MTDLKLLKIQNQTNSFKFQKWRSSLQKSTRREWPLQRIWEIWRDSHPEIIKKNSRVKTILKGMNLFEWNPSNKKAFLFRASQSDPIVPGIFRCLFKKIQHFSAKVWQNFFFKKVEIKNHKFLLIQKLKRYEKWWNPNQ